MPYCFEHFVRIECIEMAADSPKKWKTFLKSGHFKRKINKYLSITPEVIRRGKIRFPEKHGQHKRKQQQSCVDVVVEKSPEPRIEDSLLTIDRPECEFGRLSYDDGLDSTITSEALSVPKSTPSGSHQQEPSHEISHTAKDNDELIGVNYDVYKDMELEPFMKEWSIDYRIAHQALKPLLHKLNEYHPQLPVDPRRLLNTPRRKPQMYAIEGGNYWHHNLGM